MAHLSAAAAALFVTGFQPACSPPDSAELITTAVGQEQKYWCWAASGQVAMNAVHPTSQVTQCDEANRKLGPATHDCCNHPDSCNVRGAPPYAAYQFTANIQQMLSWDEIKTQVGCLRKPVPFIWKWPDGSSHMMVIVGYKTELGVAQLLVNDPLPVNQGQLHYIAYDGDYMPHQFGAYVLKETDSDVTYAGAGP